MRSIILFCLLLTGAVASAQDVLRVGSTGDYKPFSYRIGKGPEFIGLDVEMAASLAQAMGRKLEIVPTSWSSLMKDFEDGRFDIALSGISITPDRQKKALFSVAYLRDGKTSITRCENQARFQTLAQINQPGVHLIVNPGGTNERFAKANAPLAQLTVYPDNVTIFDQIVSGSADLMMTDAVETRLQQRLHPQLCAVHPDTPFDAAEKAIMLPRDPALKAFVDQWLTQRIASGEQQRGFERWLDFLWQLEPLRRAIDQRLLLAQAVARAKWNVQAPIEDLPREAQVIQAAVTQGAALGLPAEWIESVWRAQIEASKTVQRELYAKWQAQHAGKFDDAPDLAKTIRPELDRITGQLLRSMADYRALLNEPARKADVARALRPLEAAALSPAAAEQALLPFSTPGQSSSRE
jgi:chorismate mutase-like protein